MTILKEGVPGMLRRPLGAPSSLRWEIQRPLRPFFSKPADPRETTTIYNTYVKGGGATLPASWTRRPNAGWPGRFGRWLGRVKKALSPSLSCCGCPRKRASSRERAACTGSLRDERVPQRVHAQGSPPQSTRPQEILGSRLRDSQPPSQSQRRIGVCMRCEIAFGCFIKRSPSSASRNSRIV